MEAILLKVKEDVSVTNRDIVVFDELIQGTLTGEWFVPVFTEADGGMRILTFSYLVDNYCFPDTAKSPQYIKGANRYLYDKIKFYEPEEINLENP